MIAATNVLVVSSKVAIEREDGDGGGRTTVEIVEGLKGAGSVRLHLLLTRPQNVAIERWSGENGVASLTWAEPVSTATPLLAAFEDEARRTAETIASLVDEFDISVVILVHVCHGLHLKARLASGVRLLVLPMFTSVSYRRCGENVPQGYAERELDCLTHADVVITPSEYEASLLRDLGVPSDRVCRVVRTIERCAAPRRAPRTAMDTVRMVAVGAVRRQKNFAVPIRAAAAFRRLSPCSLDIAGEVQDVQYQAELEALAAELGVTSSVRWRGAMDQNQLHRLIVDCDVSLVSSLEETFGRAALESLVLGVPIVVFEDLHTIIAEASRPDLLFTVARASPPDLTSDAEAFAVAVGFAVARAPHHFDPTTVRNGSAAAAALPDTAQMLRDLLA